jgi:hypothetical protein
MEIQSNTNSAANSDCSDNKTNASTTASLKQSVQESNSFQSFDKLLRQKQINTDDLTRLLWGDSLRDEVFDRWSQGMVVVHESNLFYLIYYQIRNIEYTT